MIKSRWLQRIIRLFFAVLGLLTFLFVPQMGLPVPLSGFLIFVLLYGYLTALSVVEAKLQKGHLKSFFQHIEDFSEGKGNFRVIRNGRVGESYKGIMGPYKRLFDKLNEDLFLIKESSLKFTFFSTDMNFSSKGLTETSAKQAELMQQVLTGILQFEKELSFMGERMVQMVTAAKNNHSVYQTFMVNNKGLIDQMGQLEKQTQEAAEHLKAGQKSMEDSASQASEIHQNMGSITRSVQGIISETGQVESVLHLIDDIAESIHTLAINAAIEAARAGEKGRGFGVIAKEMHGLAAEAQRAIEDVGHTIMEFKSANTRVEETIHSWGMKTEKLKELSLQAREDFSQMEKFTRNLKKLASGVGTHLQEQVQKLEELSTIAEETRDASILVQSNMGEQQEGYTHIKESIQMAFDNALHQADVSQMLSELAQFMKVGGEELSHMIGAFVLDEESLKYRKGRNSVRHRLMYNLVVQDDQGTPIGFIGDLSPGGMMVFTEETIKTGAVQSYRLILPKLFNRDKPYVEVKGQIRWVENNLGGMLHTSFGVQFLDMDQSLSQEVEQLTESLAISKNSLFDSELWGDSEEPEELEEL